MSLDQADTHGSEAFGKCTGMDIVCVKPVGWALLCAQKKVYAQQMGGSTGESFGRLRFVVIHLDPDQTRKIPFEERLVPRAFSQELLVESLREIMLAQQSLPAGELEDFAKQYPREHLLHPT